MDEQTWRALAATRPGYATYPIARPGSPSWWRPEQPPARPAPDPRPWTSADPAVAASTLEPAWRARWPLPADPPQVRAAAERPLVRQQPEEPRCRWSLRWRWSA